MVEQETIFRKKNIESMQSPEALDNYLKVTNPGVWIFLIAVISLLIGVIVWGCLGSIDTTADAVVVVTDATNSPETANEKESYCVVAYAVLEAVINSGVVSVDGKDYKLDITDYEPAVIGEDTDILLLAEIGMNVGDYIVYIGMKDAPQNPGVYRGTVITEHIKPISLLLQ